MTAFRPAAEDTFVDILGRRAADTPNQVAFEFGDDVSAPVHMTYGDLDRRATAIAADLVGRGMTGERVLLLYPPGRDYVAGFFGCLYAGAVAVPVYPPTSARGAERVLAVAADARTAIGLIDSASLRLLEDGPLAVDALRTIEWRPSDDLTAVRGPDRHANLAKPADLALLQYTSGSTGSPKGVMLRHANLIRNSMVIRDALGLDTNSRAVSWLPPYHDMGLIGGILQPVFGGFPCVLLSPLTFLKRPYRWLEEISRTRATISAAPDFGYAECASRIDPAECAALDLSCWRHALVGAEPVRPATLRRFAHAFAHTRFRHSAFYPCYGLAEATLFVTGTSGPRLLTADRRELENGRGVPADASGSSSRSIVLTSCGRASGPDLVHVVDPDTGKRCPPGVIGEVWVSGPSVAAGYWDRPDETAATFGGRESGSADRPFLRTGDLGFCAGEDLYITGRLKDLIVVRGRNHSPSDLEQTAERAHPLLRPGRAAAFDVDDGAAERVVLVHEVRREFLPENATEVIRAVRERIAAEHGLDLKDVVLVPGGAIPRTTSGKIRRGACRERWRSGLLKALGRDTGASEASAAAVAPLVALVLETDANRISPDVALVGLGLDSLRAAHLAAEIETRFDCLVPIERLIAGMTLAELGEAVTAGGTASALPRAPQVTGDSASASPAQERIWALDQQGAGGAYHIAGGLWLSGAVDPDALHGCVGQLLRRHPGLRATFRPDADGSLRVTVRPYEAPEWSVLDLTGYRRDRVREVVTERAARPFNLAAGPLVRTTLIRFAEDEWCLGVAIHHIVADGWSLGVLLRELGALYASASAFGSVPDMPAEPDAVPPDAADDGNYWRERLASAIPLELPTDRPRTSVRSWNGAALPFDVPADAAGRIRAYAADRWVTPAMVLLAAYSTVLMRWSGQRDLLIGTTVARRERSVMANVVGLLINTLPLRVDLSGRPTFDEVVRRVRDSCVAAYAHQGRPFDQIMRDASGNRHAPLVRVLFSLRNAWLESWEAGGVRAEPFELPAPGAQFEVSLLLTERPDGSLDGHVSYMTGLYDREAMKRLVEAFVLMLDEGTTRPGVPVSSLPIIHVAERARLLGSLGGVGRPPLAHGLIHDMFQTAADAAADVPAVVTPGRTLPYRELDRLSNRLAWRLRALGVRPERAVGVCLERSAELVVALLAVLKAGGAYVPLDTALPSARHSRALADAGANVVLTTAELRDRVRAAGDARVECWDDDVFLRYPAVRPPSTVRPDNAAYILHTSGTTGVPKGAVNTHAAVANHTAWMARAHPLKPGERVLLKTPVSFDVFGLELLWPLGVGGTLVLARPGGHAEPAYLARLIREQRVADCHFVPSMLRAFLDEPGVTGCRGILRRVICSGEALPKALAERFHERLPGVELHNMYGPTEAAINVTDQFAPPEVAALGRMPIGVPIPGARLYVLDERCEIVPAHVAGELYIAGMPLARGYANRPGLTAERFVPDPFVVGERMYRTGDRVRWNADGRLEFLGRCDGQVKIRGQRLELGEVEALLESHPAVAAAVVTLRRGSSGQDLLVAHVVPEGPAPIDSRTMRDFLAARLPPVAIPKAFVELAALPVTASGKVDRAALPAVRPARPGSARPVPPADPVERQIADIWRAVLGLETVSVEDDFFDLGGDSLLATRVVVRIREAFGVELQTGELLVGRLTVRGLAKAVSERQVEEANPGEVDSVLRWMENLSDDEVRRLLDEREDH